MRSALFISILALVACSDANPPGADALWQVRCGNAPGCTVASPGVDIRAFDGQDGNEVSCALDEIVGQPTSRFSFRLRAANNQSMQLTVLVSDDGVVSAGGSIVVTDIVNGEPNRLTGTVSSAPPSMENPCQISRVEEVALDEGPARSFTIRCENIFNEAAPANTLRDLEFPPGEGMPDTDRPAEITVFNCDGF